MKKYFKCAKNFFDYYVLLNLLILFQCIMKKKSFKKYIKLFFIKYNFIYSKVRS